MRIAFYVYKELNVGKERETEIVESFRLGVGRNGDQIEFFPAKNYVGALRGFDVVCGVGLRQHARRILKSYRRIGTRVLLFDKGLIRTRNISLYNRIGLDSGVPNKYMMRIVRSDDRWKKLMRVHRQNDRYKVFEIEVRPRRNWTPDNPIIYANNSQKVHDFWGMGNEREYTQRIMADLENRAGIRPLVFRPKPGLLNHYKSGEMPSYDLPGVRISEQPEMIEDALVGSHVLVTHTSNTAVNAIIAGIPAIVTGPCVASVLCSHSLDDLDNPPFPSDEQRMQWLYNLAYCQWSDAEMASGEMWAFFKEELAATA